MKLLPYNFSNPIFSQCIKQPDNQQAAYFCIWNNFCCDYMLVNFLELECLARKKREKNQLCFLVSVLFSRQNKRFSYFKHPLVIYSLTTQNVVHGPVALAFSVTLTECRIWSTPCNMS